MSEVIQAVVAAKSFTIAEWCHARRVGRTRAFEEISSGRLRTYKVGRRRYVSEEADLQWARDREDEANPPQDNPDDSADRKYQMFVLGERS